MQKRNLRIFIGPVEIASIVGILANTLRSQNIRVTAVATGTSPFFDGMEYDMVLNLHGNILQRIFKHLHYFLKFFFQHDAFIFLFGATLLPYNLDLPFLKLFRKKTVMWFLGSDIRHYESVQVTIEKMGIKYRQSEDRRERPDRVEQKKAMIRRVEKYVDYIICGPSNAQLLTRNYLGKDMESRIYLPLDVENIRCNSTPNTKPVLMHCPSQRARKGTSYVLAAIEQLKKESYDFEFSLFENKSNVEIREALSQADIAIDQLLATGPGMFATEAMAAGCAVLGGNIPEFYGYPIELPVIHTDPDNIYDNLKMLLENPDLRRELGEKGRKYVEKYHDSAKIADQILKLLSGNTEGLITYDPQG